MRLTAIIIALLLSFPVFAGEGKPTVVSLDSCSDQLVLALADDNQILSLSRDATGPFSYFLERAQDFPTHQGSAEEILLLHPDVVLSTGAGDPALVKMLEDLGFRVVKTGLPGNMEEALKSLEAVGRTLKQGGTAARLAASTKERLAALESAPGALVSAVYMSPSGITTGSGTFLDEVLLLAGLDNLMADGGVTGWASFDVESFITIHPDVLVTSFFDSKVGNAESWRFSEHPAVREVMNRTTIVDVPSKYLSCPAWYAIEGAEYIRARLEEGAGNAEAP